MALTVETGANIPNANSYVDVTGIRAYAAERNLTLPAAGGAGDTAIEQYVFRVMEWLNAQSYKGTRTYTDQALPFPRALISIDGVALPMDAIPARLKDAESRLVCLIHSGIDLFPTSSGQAVKRKRTGPLEKEFFEPGSGPVLRAVDAILSPLLRNAGQLTTLRI